MRLRREYLGVGLLGAALLLGMVAHQASRLSDTTLSLLAQTSFDQKIDGDMMKKYEADQQAQDHEIMNNAAKMNDQWGGSFSNGVGSNTWKGTPWGKYDDAVARRKQMLLQLSSGHDDSMEAYDEAHQNPIAQEALREAHDDSVHSALAKLGQSPQSVGLEGSVGDDQRLLGRREGVGGGGRLGAREEVALGEEPAIMTDDDAGELEDERPPLISREQSMKECEASCNKMEGCILACKKINDPPPASAIGTEGPTHTQHLSGWQREKEEGIIKCKKACHSAECVVSCTDPLNIVAPEPTEEDLSPAEGTPAETDVDTEELLELPAARAGGGGGARSPAF